jgi:hypothetical protein
MISRKAVAVIVLVALGLGSLLTVAIAWSTSRDEPQWLLTHTSGAAEMEMQSKTQGTLRLSEPNEEFFLFTDRPERRTAELAIPALIDQWSDVFGNDPPNAALVHGDDGHPVAILELTSPESVDGDLSFEVRVVSTPAGPLPDSLSGGVHLFIDPPAARLTDFRQCPMGGSC